MLARDSTNVPFSTQRPSSCAAEMEEAAAAMALTVHCRKNVGPIGWGGRSRAPPICVRRGVGDTVTSVERSTRRILRVIHSTIFSKKIMLTFTR